MYGKNFSLSSITMLLDCVSPHDSNILIDLKQVLLVENHDPDTYVFTKPKKITPNGKMKYFLYVAGWQQFLDINHELFTIF